MHKWEFILVLLACSLGVSGCSVLSCSSNTISEKTISCQNERILIANLKKNENERVYFTMSGDLCEVPK